MSVYQNINGSLYRMDASDLVQLAAVDTENILGGGAGAATNGQTLVNQLAADDVQTQTDIGQIKTDLPNYLTIADEQVLGAWNLLSVPASVVTQTNNGVTFTITRDSGGQVTEVDANGTAGTGGSRFAFIGDNVIRKGRYYAKNGTGYSINYQENGVVNHSGNTDDFVVDWSQDIACRIIWDIAANAQVNHVKFYPQLALKPNMPYVPFAMTNAELTNGLVFKGSLSSANNLNNVTETGLYYLTSSPTNTPEGRTYATLIVTAQSSSSIRQILITNGSIIYIRSYSGSPTAWTSWYKFTGTVVS